MEITKEQVKEYISKNFDIFFVDALAKYVKDAIFPFTDKESVDDYKDELKQLIWEGISNGVKEYLREYDGEGARIISQRLIEEIIEKISDAEISIKF